jgi:alpha-L-rhamnosidase
MMRFAPFLLASTLLLLVAAPAHADRRSDPLRPAVSQLLANSLHDPIGIAGGDPRLSWQLDAEHRGVTQTAYQVRVASTADRLRSPDVWDSGKVRSGRSVDVAYGGPELRSHSAYSWSVRVWAEADDGDRSHGKGRDREAVSDWSDPASFETVLLSAAEWTGDWIGAPGIGREWTDYTIEFTASDIESALGVYFRGRDTEHAYMWQISESARALRPHVKDPGYAVLPATPFPEGFDFGPRHRYAIAVEGDTITTYVDGEQLDSRTDATHTAPGVVGFRTSGQESGLVHDVKVTGTDGSVLVDTDFPPGDRSFTAGTVTDDGLLVDRSGPEAWLALLDTVPILRKDFAANDAPVKRARIYASAQGLYELRLNGERVGDHELAPGWTDYHKRIQYQTYDVTELVKAGGNAIGAELADGWFGGRVAMFGDRVYGTDTALIAQLRIEYADGSVQVVDTDETWRTTRGPITAADLLDGEAYDARRAEELGHWSDSPYDDAAWEPVVVRPSATGKLEPQEDQPVRVTQELSAERIASPTPGTFIYDLGQNMVGKVRLTLSGARGQTVRIRHAEVLNPDGSIYTANLRSASATDYYTFAGSGPETFEPSFTFHGFRYVEITGVDSPPDASAITGVVMGTDGDLVSELDTSSDLVDQLHSNIVWGQRGNFLSIPTDTPARDERMGWTGDIDVFARTAVYNMDSQAFLTKWLQDLRDSQREDGSLPGVAPIIPGRFDGGYGAAGWADAGVHVPWTLWQAYGDTNVIAENYEMMKRYVDYLAADSTNHIRSTGGYLDWLNLDDPTPADVLDTAFVAKSTREFAEMAAAMGRTADADAYDGRFEDIRAAFQEAFIAEDGTVKGDSQTGYILAITNDLVPAALRDAVTGQFVETIERRDGHLSTGFLGVDGLLPALTAVGRTDVAYRLLQNEDYPSWGYEIGKGATTIWERWNSIMPDGSFGPVGMNSFNHYAYGAVGEWMYRTLGGVSALEPGYKRVLVAPQPGDGISSARFSHETRYGTVATAWETTGDGLTLDVSVPANTTAELRMPSPSRWAVTEGGKPAEESDAVRFVKMDGATAVYELGSGRYSFAVDQVLGNLGDAAADTSALAELAGDRLDGSAGRHVERAAADIGRAIEKAWSSRLRNRSQQGASDVHRALSEIADLDGWIAEQAERRRIDAADAAALRGALRPIERRLSAASAALLGAAATLVVPQDEHVPGDELRVRVVVENRGDRRLDDLRSSLEAPSGWSVEPAGTPARSVAPGASVSHDYDVRIPADAPAGTSELAGTLRYRYERGTATLPVPAGVDVLPAIAVSAVEVSPVRVHPGDEAIVRTVLLNRTDVARSGELGIELPAGWTAPVPTPYDLGPGAEVTVETPVDVPLSVTDGLATVAASTGAERATASLDVVFRNPPAVVHDHVDLGDADSERNHGLTASPSSGTNTEAGLTRRYTNAAQPGGWFEFDVRVPAGEPFVLRSVETYDQAQLKTYEVLLDGVRVHERAHRRTAGGAGSQTFQFVIDEPALTEDGVVRVRFQDVGQDYDPSIADVWATPATGGLDG